MIGDIVGPGQSPLMLVYRSSDGETYTVVDRVPVGGDITGELPRDVKRERALCRAVLEHALFLLGPEEGDW